MNKFKTTVMCSTQTKLKHLLFWAFFLTALITHAQEKKQPLREFLPNNLIDPVIGCSIFSQSSSNYDCGLNFTFPAPTNNNYYSFPAGANLGCLGSAPNQTWFLVTVTSANSSRFTFVQNNSSGYDVDAAIYGPIQNNNVNFACNATLNPPLSCDFSSASQSTLTINNVIVGQKFIMVVTNYSNSNTDITINQPSGGTVEYCKSNYSIPSPCPNIPVASLNGSKVINEGQNANLTLSYSGVAPLNYTINGIGTGVANTNPMNIQVNPTQTTTFKLLSASNNCGNLTLTPDQATIVVQNLNSTKKLVSCFPFDGNANDQKGINLTSNNGAVLTSDRFGNPNSAYLFNGNSNISITSNELLNNEFTYSAWVKPTSLPSEGELQTIFSIGANGGDQFIAINNSYFGDTEQRPKWNLPNFTGHYQSGPYLLSNELIHENIWYFVTFVRSLDSLKVYINGEKSNSIFSSGRPPYYAGSSVKIGSRFNGFFGFRGVIDDLKIFKGELSKEEIKVLYLTQTCNFEYLEKRKVELISCYNFSGNTIDGVNQINASLNNLTLTTDRFGNSNSAYLFNGSGDLNIPANSFLLNNYSISLWVKATTINSNQVIYSMGSLNSNQVISLINNSTSGFTPTFQFSSTMSNGTITSTYSNATRDQWYHLVAIKEPSRIRFYINGQKVSEKGILNNAETNYGNGPYFVSVGSNNGLNKFQGIIDDLKIFNGSLYEEEVKEIYQQTNSNCSYSPCPTYKLITGSNASNHRASILLEGKNINTLSSNVEFKSGKSIILQPGFNSNSDVVFKATITGCSNVPPTGSSLLILQPGPIDGEDGEVSSVVPNTVLGNAFSLNPLAWTQHNGLNIKRSFIKFDYSQLPSNAIIDSAHLSLYFSQALVDANFPTFSGHTGSNAIEIKRVTGLWSESFLTWNNQPNTSNLNQVLLPAAITNSQNYLKIDVKNMVNDMKINGNNGFMIKHQIEDPSKITCLTSSDEINPIIRPKLEIYYH